MIKNLKEDCVFEIGQVGSKAYQLHNLAQKGFDVCDGYVLTTDFFRRYRICNDIELSSVNIEEELLKGQFNEECLSGLNDIYHCLTQDGQQLIVRSSAVEEDTKDKSYAGIYASYSGISTFENMLAAIKQVWRSYFSKQAKAYRDCSLKEGNMAVLIQKQILVEKSGVLFTKNPVTGSSEIVIEMCHGGNEKIIQNQSEAERILLSGRHVRWVRSGCLTKAEQKKLYLTAKRLERLTGCPCDMEWGMQRKRIFLFQVRPVVHIHRRDLYCENLQDDADGILLDRYANPASVCYLSILDQWQDRVYLSYYEKKRGYLFEERPLIFRYNRVYWNMAYQKKYFEEDGRDSRKKSRKFETLVVCGYRSWYIRLKLYEIRLYGFGRRFQGMKDDRERIDLLERVMENFCDFIGIDHYRFLGIAQILYKRSQRLMEERGYDIKQMNQSMGRLIQRNMTEKANSELLQLLVEIEKDPYLTECFQEKDPKEILKIIKNQYADTYYRQFSGFVKRHGHRGIDCDDLMYPHWREEPWNIILLMKQLMFSEGAAGEKTEAVNVLIKDRKVQRLLKKTGTYMCLRENQRYYFDKSWILIRSILLKVAEGFLEKGFLKNQEDIFHMTIEEIKDRVRYVNDCIPDDLVEERKTIFIQQRKTEPPYIIKGLENIAVQKNHVSQSYKVMGISAGRAGGKVRTVSCMDQIGQIEKGDIVIVKTFHPSWTPILKIVSGLIMNYGNMLSHGAVVAREYQIPVVVFNADASKLLQNGDFVEIDGTRGRLRVLAKGGEA